MARDRGVGCPQRWRLIHSSRYSQPHRPPVCPCLWSPSLISQHFQKMIASDLSLGLSLSQLMSLWPD